jgi:hypothetical protein
MTHFANHAKRVIDSEYLPQRREGAKVMGDARHPERM